ncbi:MAG: TIGR02466 family protein [Pseudomonadota bacterium]|nr:TIGR02466 family protein [Pseudomonadota bacterium]
MSAPDPLAPIPLFSFPLFSSVIAGFEEHRAPLLAEILDLKRQYPGVVRSNRNAWHSGDEFLAHKSEHVAWLLQKVTRFGRFALARYHDNWASSELQLGGCWANVLEPGGWNAPHHHVPCHWSGVFYVSVGTLGTKPGDPGGMIEFLNPTPLLSAVGQGGSHAYAPKDGLMLVFPSSIYHFVHPHAGDEIRVSVAYNFNVVPKPRA